MKIQIDTKSIVIGFLVGAFGMLTLGDTTGPNSKGRYQCSVGVSNAGHAVELIIDTQTGQAWNAATDYTVQHDDGDKFWSPKE